MNPYIPKIGFWAGLIACIATLAYVTVQLLQLYGMLAYPSDEILIYSTSLCIVLPFVLAMQALHYTVPEEKRFWSHAALNFTMAYATLVTINYVVQLATVIPMTLKGRLHEVRLLQQTPHSLFWNFDALGYIFMGLAAAMAIPVFERKGFQKWVRLSFVAHALVTPLIAFVYFYPVYSYRLLVLGFPWGITAPLFMLMLAILFYKNGHPQQRKEPLATKASKQRVIKEPAA
jgi:hypothetical protein